MRLLGLSDWTWWIGGALAAACWLALLAQGCA